MGYANPEGIAWGGIAIQAEILANFQPHLTIGKFAKPKLGPLQISQHRQGPTHLKFGSTDVGDGGGMIGVATMAEIDPKHISPSTRQGDHLITASAGRAQGGDNARAAGADHSVGLVMPGSLRSLDQGEGSRRTPAAGAVGLGCHAGLAPSQSHTVDPGPGLLDLITSNK